MPREYVGVLLSAHCANASGVGCLVCERALWSSRRLYDHIGPSTHQATLDRGQRENPDTHRTGDSTGGDERKRVEAWPGAVLFLPSCHGLGIMFYR